MIEKIEAGLSANSLKLVKASENFDPIVSMVELANILITNNNTNKNIIPSNIRVIRIDPFSPLLLFRNIAKMK